MYLYRDVGSSKRYEIVFERAGMTVEVEKRLKSMIMYSVVICKSRGQRLAWS